jgi:hypothetical protein
MAFGQILLSIFGLMMIGVTFARASARSKTPGTTLWPTTMGRVVESKKVEGISHIGKPDSTRFKYEYNVEGKKFSNNSLTLFDGPAALGQAYITYPEDTSVKVFYNPENPAESLIEPGTENELFGRGPFGTLAFWLSQAFFLGIAYVFFSMALSEA